jgi:1-phosphofructokinase family hexose kinase
MIYCITPNPALDVSGIVDSLVPDEKSYVFDERLSAGGNGINAATIARRLGAPVLASGFLGGANGDEIQLLLDREKMPAEFIRIQGRTRMNLTVSNRKTNKQTRLSFPGPEIKRSEKNALAQVLERSVAGDLVLFGGSLPPGFTPREIGSLIRKLHRRGVVCLVDMPGKILSSLVGARPEFIKPNLVEFQELTGSKASSIRDLLPIVIDLNRQVRLICVSSVEGGAILARDGEVWYGRIPKVKIRSTVGAGDSMVGAMASVLHRRPEAPLEDLLRLGLAAACATLTETGMVLGSRKNIQKYAPRIVLRKIT